jgi:hypothetical protein
MGRLNNSNHLGRQGSQWRWFRQTVLVEPSIIAQ